MTTLSSADLRNALVAAGEWHKAATLAELETAALAALEVLIPCDGIGWNEVDMVGGSVRVLTSPHDYLVPERVAVLDRLLDQHPIVSYVDRTGDTTAHTISDFVSVRELHRLELYADFFRPLEIEDLLAMIVRADTLIVGIAFTRGRRSWLSRDRELLNVLQPHLAAAYANVAARLTAQERIAELERGLEGRTVVALAVDGRLEQRPELLERWFGRETRAPAPGVYEREDAVLTVRRVDGDPPLLLLDERRHRPDPERVRELGLSLREAEIVALAGRGLGDGEIARELFISVRTVSKHLQHAYDKLGVRSRNAAAARLLGT